MFLKNAKDFNAILHWIFFGLWDVIKYIFRNVTGMLDFASLQITKYKSIFLCIIIGSVALLWRNAKCNVNPGLSHFEQCALHFHLHFAFYKSKATDPLLSFIYRNLFWIFNSRYEPPSWKYIRLVIQNAKGGKEVKSFWDDQDHDHIITSCITWENSVAMSMLLARQYRHAYTQCHW